jgi:MFS family permease
VGGDRPRTLKVAIFAHGLLRVAGSAGGVVVGVWLAALSRQGLPIHANLVGALAASAFGAELVCSVPLGVAADAVSVRWLMSAGALVGALAMLLFGLSVLVPVFFLSRLLEGVAVLDRCSLMSSSVNTLRYAGRKLLTAVEVSPCLRTTRKHSIS